MYGLSGFKKGVVVDGLPFYLESRTTGQPITSGNVTIYYIVDDSGQGILTATPAHKGGGQWTTDISALEMNGEVIGLLVTHPEANTVHITLKTGNDVGSLDGDEEAASNLSGGANELARFVVGASPTATSIPTDITGLPYTNADHFEGRVVSINKETRKIFGSGGSPVVLTTEAFNSVPSQNDPGVIS